MNPDNLSIIRTHLANERTALAYIRTSLAFLAAGVGLIHFFPSFPLLLVGWLIVGIGSFFLVFGILRSVFVRRRINKLGKKEVAS